MKHSPPGCLNEVEKGFQTYCAEMEPRQAELSGADDFIGSSHLQFGDFRD